MSARRRWRAVACLVPLAPLASLLLLAGPATAAEFDWSGFVRAGYARSNQAQVYDRLIDDNGTWRRDSIAGLQLDVQFTPRWSATVQGTLAPVGQDDRRRLAGLPWAVLSYRAGNDLTLRAGRQRVPMFLNSENSGVGAAFSMTRLPAEMYSVAPNTDFTGLSASKSWDVGMAELSLDGYAGTGDLLYRRYYHETGMVGQSSSIERAGVGSAGLVLTLRKGDDVYRAGIHRFAVDADGYSGGNAVASDAAARILSAGASVGLGHGARATAELAQRSGGGANSGYASRSGYLALEWRHGAWTPYAKLARLLIQQPDRMKDASFAYDGVVPPVAPSVGELFGKASGALGLSYASSPMRSWKGEWMRVRTAEQPGPANQLQPHPQLTVWSLSYNVVF